jgi:hypothetical protein
MKHDKTTRQTIYKGRVLNLYLDNNHWEIAEHKPAVAILAVQDGKMLLVRQYRAPLETETLEIPAGGSRICRRVHDGWGFEFDKPVLCLAWLL